MKTMKDARMGDAIASCDECDMFPKCRRETGAKADDKGCWEFLPAGFFLSAGAAERGGCEYG